MLPILQQLPEVRFESVELTDTNMYLKCVTPRLTFEMAPGDIVQAGVVISNSEVGQGTLSVQPLLYRLVCRNGLIASDRSLRKTHIGRRSRHRRGSHHGVPGRHAARRRQAPSRLESPGRRLRAAASEATFRQTASCQKTLPFPLVGDPVKWSRCWPTATP